MFSALWRPYPTVGILGVFSGKDSGSHIFWCFLEPLFLIQRKKNANNLIFDYNIGVTRNHPNHPQPNPQLYNYVEGGFLQKCRDSLRMTQRTKCGERSPRTRCAYTDDPPIPNIPSEVLGFYDGISRHCLGGGNSNIFYIHLGEMIQFD